MRREKLPDGPREGEQGETTKGGCRNHGGGSEAPGGPGEGATGTQRAATDLPLTGQINPPVDPRGPPGAAITAVKARGGGKPSGRPTDGKRERPAGDAGLAGHVGSYQVNTAYKEKDGGHFEWSRSGRSGTEEGEMIMDPSRSNETQRENDRGTGCTKDGRGKDRGGGNVAGQGMCLACGPTPPSNNSTVKGGNPVEFTSPDTQQVGERGACPRSQEEAREEPARHHAGRAHGKGSASSRRTQAGAELEAATKPTAADHQPHGLITNPERQKAPQGCETGAKSKATAPQHDEGDPGTAGEARGTRDSRARRSHPAKEGRGDDTGRKAPHPWEGCAGEIANREDNEAHNQYQVKTGGQADRRQEHPRRKAQGTRQGTAHRHYTQAANQLTDDLSTGAVGAVEDEQATTYTDGWQDVLKPPPQPGSRAAGKRGRNKGKRLCKIHRKNNFRDSSSDTGSSESTGQGRRKHRPLTRSTVERYWA